MSTKRVFDDMYLYLKEENIRAESLDPMNQLPANTYEEITTRYWNLIYKEGTDEIDYSQNSVPASGGGKRPAGAKKQYLTIKDIEKQFDFSHKNRHNLNNYELWVESDMF